ncbi:MAG: recombination regulator RecX [Clostridiales Family XIII bacterium]|jgi:regulatory protein|nr:recombination regulator RecX [Clostridiales Family XIII bacterium]
MNSKEKPRRAAFDKALSLIERQERTEYQIRLSLTKAGYDEDEANEALARLIDAGLVNDREYAGRYLEILIEKRRGRRRVVDEMRRRGLDAFLIEDVLAEGYPEDVEEANALVVARKALDKLPDDLDKRADRRKIAGKISIKLTGQGYNFDLINRTVEKVLGDLEQES